MGWKATFSVVCFVFLLFIIIPLTYGKALPTGREVCVGVIKIACNSDKTRANVAKTFLKKLPRMKLQSIDDEDFLLTDGLVINSPVKILSYEGLFRSVSDAYSYLDKASKMVPSNACLVFEKKIEIRDEFEREIELPSKHVVKTKNWYSKLTIDLMKYIRKEDMEKAWQFFGKNKPLPKIVRLVFFSSQDIKTLKNAWSKYFEQFPLKKFRHLDVRLIQPGGTRIFVTCGVFETFEEADRLFRSLREEHHQYARKKAHRKVSGIIFLPPVYENPFVFLGERKYFLVSGEACGTYTITGEKIEPTVKEDLRKKYKIIAGIIENNEYALSTILAPVWAKKFMQYFPKSLSFNRNYYNEVITINCGNFSIKYTDYKNFRLEIGIKLALNKQIALLASQYRGITVSPDFDLSTAFVKYIIEKLPDNIFSDWEFYKEDPEDKYIGKVMVIVSALERIKNDGNISLLNQIIEDFVKDRLAVQ